MKRKENERSHSSLKLRYSMYVSGFSLHIHLLGRAPIPASTPKILILHTHNCKTQLISRLICRSGIGPKYHAAPTKTNFNKISNISERGASRTPLDAYDTPPPDLVPHLRRRGTQHAVHAADQLNVRMGLERPDRPDISLCTGHFLVCCGCVSR